MTDTTKDSRFNGLVYLNGSTTIGGFFHDADDVSLRLSGKRAGTTAHFNIYDADREEVGTGSFDKPAYERSNPNSPVVTGRMVLRGESFKIAGWINVVNGDKVLSIKRDAKTDAIDPSDVYA